MGYQRIQARREREENQRYERGTEHHSKAKKAYNRNSFKESFKEFRRRDFVEEYAY